MPELPEVETVRRGLNRLLPGLVIKSVEVINPKSFISLTDAGPLLAVDATIVCVRRRAKVLLIELTNQYSLVIHLKMTGQLLFQNKNVRFGAGHPTNSLIGMLPDKTTRVIFTFKDGSKLYFNDQRKFGWIRLLPTVEVPNVSFIKKLGPEPLESSFTWQTLKGQLHRRPKSNIKSTLLDQTIIAGVGNIYADESLWGAKIHPQSLVRQLSDTKIKVLYLSLVAILQLSINQGGSTDRNYVDAEGQKGNYLQFAKVFRRNGQACPRCGTTIQKIRVAGRGTHLCPGCQKRYRNS